MYSSKEELGEREDGAEDLFRRVRERRGAARSECAGVLKEGELVRERSGREGGERQSTRRRTWNGLGFGGGRTRTEEGKVYRRVTLGIL